jgi:hypothetical protein
MESSSTSERALTVEWTKLCDERCVAFAVTVSLFFWKPDEFEMVQ